MKSTPQLLSGASSVVHLEVVPRRAPASAKLDPTTTLFDKLVDDTCKLTSETAGAFRVLKEGDPETAAIQMRKIIKSFAEVQGRAQVVLWELTKPAAFYRKPRRLMLVKATESKSPRPSRRLLA